jgi:hypothetical protein
MREADRVSMPFRLLRHERYLIKIERRFESEIRLWDPAEPSVRDHDVRLRLAIRVASNGDV